MEPSFVVSPQFHCGGCEFLLREKYQGTDVYYCKHFGATSLGSNPKAYIGTSDTVPGWCPLREGRPTKPSSILDGEPTPGVRVPGQAPTGR